MTDSKPSDEERRPRKVQALRFSTVEYGDVCRAARILGARPATWARDQIVERAREVIDREAAERERR